MWAVATKLPVHACQAQIQDIENVFKLQRRPSPAHVYKDHLFMCLTGQAHYPTWFFFFSEFKSFIDYTRQDCNHSREY
jgi:hypothetical protein